MLSCLPTLAADPTATLVGRFRSRYPGVRVDLAAPEDSRELFELVENGTSELGLTDALDVPDALVSTTIGSQVLVFIVPPETTVPLPHLLHSPTSRTPCSWLAEGTSTRRLLDERLGSVHLKPRLAVVTAQRDAILPLVLAGAGAALVPESMALVAEQLGAMVARPDPPAVRELALVHRAGAHSRRQPPGSPRWPCRLPSPRPDLRSVVPSAGGGRATGLRHPAVTRS